MITISIDSTQAVALVCAAVALLLEAFTIGLLVERRHARLRSVSSKGKED